MASIRIKKKITSSTINIKELKKFIGKEVEIFIKEDKGQSKNQNRGKKSKNASAMLEKYKNTNLVDKEKQAWSQAIKDKYANR
ncbi:MAG: hypothetical protein KGY69_14690 [Bacteroidales bacterium]|nr:hypothetical protein [Bacteroidales bacterium]